MSSKAALIIGASRGVGLGLAREFAARGYTVHATQRSHSETLAQAASASDGAIQIHAADVTDESSIAALAERIGAESLDLLVLNAGVYGQGEQTIPSLSREDMADTLMTNAIGPVQAAVALLPTLAEGATIGMMTSRMGSIDDSSGGSNLYRVSKVAQNMLARSLYENHAKPRGIAVLSLHPGWVRTAMGGPDALIEVEESARGLADRLEEARVPAHIFVNYDGTPLPW